MGIINIILKFNSNQSCVLLFIFENDSTKKFIQDIIHIQFKEEIKLFQKKKTTEMYNNFSFLVFVKAIKVVVNVKLIWLNVMKK